jgi:hypothetical protein
LSFQEKNFATFIIFFATFFKDKREILQESVPMSSYLLAIAITNYEPVKSSVESKVFNVVTFLNESLISGANDMKQLKLSFQMIFK